MASAIRCARAGSSGFAAMLAAGGCTRWRASTAYAEAAGLIALAVVVGAWIGDVF